MSAAAQKQKARKKAARAKKRAAEATASADTETSAAVAVSAATAASAVEAPASAATTAAASAQDTKTSPAAASTAANTASPLAMPDPKTLLASAKSFTNPASFDSVVEVRRTATRGNSCFARSAMKAGQIIYREVAPCSAAYGYVMFLLRCTSRLCLAPHIRSVCHVSSKDKDETMLALAAQVVHAPSCDGMYFHVEDTDRKTFVTEGGPPPLPPALATQKISEKKWCAEEHGDAWACVHDELTCCIDDVLMLLG
jgi:hypothetical protein